MSKAGGDYGEDLACKYLNKLGYKILERNYRIRGGEIDIVAKDKEYLTFVEVKTRWSHECGLPVESVTPWNIKALLKTALFYNLKEIRFARDRFLFPHFLPSKSKVAPAW